MSLVMGLHLLERFYLVSDTRVTSENSSREFFVIKDDLIKAFVFNKRISAVVAGQALPASYLLNKLKEKVTNDSTIDDLKQIIQSDLRKLISDYVNTTGYHRGQVALIFAGFNLNKSKLIEVSLLGNAMSEMVKNRGEGVQVNQSLSNKLIQALGNIGGKKKGDYLEVKDVFSSKMFAVTVTISTAEWELVDIDCYQYAIFHPDQSVKKVDVPLEILSQLEFRNRAGRNWEDIMYEEAEYLMSFVSRTASEQEFWTVGGNIFTLMQSSEGAIYPTGDIAKVKDGKPVIIGSILVENGELVYKLEDGKTRKYRHIEEIAKDYLLGASKTDLAKLLV